MKSFSGRTKKDPRCNAGLIRRLCLPLIFRTAPELNCGELITVALSLNILTTHALTVCGMPGGRDFAPVRRLVVFRHRRDRVHMAEAAAPDSSGASQNQKLRQEDQPLLKVDFANSV